MKRSLSLLTVCIAAALDIYLLTGCAALFGSSQRRSSSVMDYLYSSDKAHVDSPDLPTLTLQPKAGVAFVPETQTKETHGAPFS